MTAVKKFLFDTVFDGLGEALPEAEDQGVAEDGPQQEAEAQEEQPPTFSQEDVGAARQEGFAAGKDEGLREAGDATERQLAETLATIGRRLPEFFELQQRANATAAADAVAVAVAIARKVLPDLAERNALGEIERMVKAAMPRILEEPRLVLRVNEALKDALAERLEAVIAGSGYEGKVVSRADADLSVGDCRVEWADGGAERDSAALWQEIDAIIEQNLHSPAAHAGTAAAADAPGGTVEADRAAAGDDVATGVQQEDVKHGDDNMRGEATPGGSPGGVPPALEP